MTLGNKTGYTNEIKIQGKMTASIVGPRSSTPKLTQAQNRTLPKVPKPQVTDSKKPGKHGRVLPLVPAATQHQEGHKLSRSLPRVPAPLVLKTPPGTSGSGSSNKSNNTNPAIPTVPKTSTRQLPKIPRTIAIQNKKQEQDRKKYMHSIYKSEGDDHLRKGELEKALESYHSALKLIPEDKSTLVARSRCHQLLGRHRKAMQDVESALSLDPLYYEALYQKAELHYQQREYEMALVFFNKGHKQRPDMKAFQEGLERTQDAINRSDSARNRRLAKVGDISFFLPKKKKDTKRRVQLPPEPPDKKPRDLATPGFRLRHQNPLVKIERGSKESLVTDINDIEMTSENDVTEKRMKQILGRMYNDKKYLEQLVEQAGGLTVGSVDLHSMAENGLDFLYDRVLYWVRQGRIIPPEAPSDPAEKPTQHDSNNMLPNINSPRSDSSRDTKVNTKPKVSRKQMLLNEDKTQPKSWFRYLEKKKAAENSTRKNNQTRFLHVLEGQRLQLKENLENRKPLTPIKQTKPQIRDRKLKKTGRKSKDRDRDQSVSDTESCLNISFSTYRQPSDLYHDHHSLEDTSAFHTIKEESPLPLRVVPLQNSRVHGWSKKDRSSQEAAKREQIQIYITKELEDIEIAYVDGRYADCMHQSESCLNTLKSFTEIQVPNLMSVIAKLHSYIGNAAIETRDYLTALDHHERDLLIGEENNDDDAVSRALGNLGRIFVFQNKHQQALELFSRKVPLCKTRLETAWLYHEIGNCFLVLGQYKFAMEAAHRSLKAAEEAVEWSYQLQSLVLLGVAEVKLKHYTNAINTFERAREQARMQGDNKAEEAITEALNDVNTKMIEEMRTARGDHSRSERGYPRSRAEYSDKYTYNPRSRAEWSDYSSIFIPDDDGDVSLTETGYDTDNLHLDLDQLRGDLETSLFGSQAALRSERHSTKLPTSEVRKSMMNLHLMQSPGRRPNSSTYIRSNTAMG